MKINPLLIAAIGGAAIFFLWKQRTAEAKITNQQNANAPATSSYKLTTASVPQEWIETTPEGYTVVGTSTDKYDILT